MLFRMTITSIFCFLVTACQPRKKSDAQVEYVVGDWWSDSGSNLLSAIRDGRSISICFSSEGLNDQQKFATDSDKFERIVRSALEEWLTPLKLNLNITRTQAPCRSDLKQGYLQVVLHYDEAHFQSRISQTSSPTLGVFLVGDGGLHLNVLGVLNPARDATLGYKTTLHELGHAFGLTHSNVAGAVMQAYLSRAASHLTADDVAGIQAVWSRISQNVGNPSSRYKPGRTTVLGETKQKDTGSSHQGPSILNSDQVSGSLPLSLRYDSWFKTSTAQSFVLGETQKCALKVDQKLKVQILDAGNLHSGHLRVKLLETLSGCEIGRAGAIGFLYAQHLDQ